MRQQKRHLCTEQYFGLCGRGRGWMIWENGIEIRIISYMERVASPGSMHNWMLGAGALGRPRGMVWGGRREEGSGRETHVYLWRIHFNIWQNQYNIVKFKKKKKDTCTPVFVAAQFTIARTHRQTKCSSADEWIKQLWYIYIMEFTQTQKGTHLSQV